ncbi:MAG: hypothetical protein V4555_15480 [Acidobacteriota bacterium]
MSRAVLLDLAAGLLVAAAAAAAVMHVRAGESGGLRAEVRHVLGASEVAAQGVDAGSLAKAAAVPRAFYGKRLEPRASVVLQGAGQSDGVSFAAYSDAVKPARPLLSMNYVDLHDDLPGFFAREKAELAKYPELIVPQIGLAMNEGDAKRNYAQEVADGVDDAQLKALCAGLKSLDRPVFLRVGYEFNGPWNGYEPRAYVAAFRHVVEAVRGCGLENVAMVWDWAADQELDAERGGAAASGADARRDRFYPGDAWVDWWGINLFSKESLTAASTQAFLADAEKHGFPVMIGESTPLHFNVADGQRAVDGWFAPYFGLMRRSKGIKAFCYIDWDWSAFPQWKDWGDARIEKNAVVLGYYRGQVGAPLFAGAMGKAETLKLLRVK